ncbi:MAG: putrescine ABC transporter permease PotH, partial [Sinobacteraceae bacterium]|nr:putrescine ABC transporter permease PotH [Nevskiaceae bacterium]
MRMLERPGRWLIILPPLLFLTVFFLIPFAFAFKISLAETAPRVPPFTDILARTPDGHLQLSISLANFKYLLTDEVYGVAYLYSL